LGRAISVLLFQKDQRFEEIYYYRNKIILLAGLQGLNLKSINSKEKIRKKVSKYMLGEITYSDNINIGWTGACGSSTPRQRKSFKEAIRSLRRRDALDRFV
jgi:hypothetical protein